MTTVESVILGIVEGLTEFIPVSSTGHLILTEALLKMQGSKFLEVFTIVVQMGAILSVVILYFKRFFQSLDFYYKLFVAFIPTGVAGLLLHHVISNLLKSVTTVAISLIAGGVVLIIVDFIFKKQIEEVPEEGDLMRVKKIDEFGVERTKEVLRKFKIGWSQAFFIGCFQCAALIPGVSRSAATIIGGLFQKLNIKTASEFSFFLAVPTLFAASVMELYGLRSYYSYIKGSEIGALILGIVVSFVVGIIAIRFFIGLITRFGLKFFGIYRIILGATILTLLALGYKIEILN